MLRASLCAAGPGGPECVSVSKRQKIWRRRRKEFAMNIIKRLLIGALLAFVGYFFAGFAMEILWDNMGGECAAIFGWGMYLCIILPVLILGNKK